VLSKQEQHIWDGVQRYWAEEVEEPPRASPAAPRRRVKASRDPADLPTAVVVGGWIMIMLVLFGAPGAGLAVGVTTALGWALWHSWPRLRKQGPSGTLPDSGKDKATYEPVTENRPRHPRRSRDAD
jgi:hypothetical protein